MTTERPRACAQAAEKRAAGRMRTPPGLTRCSCAGDGDAARQPAPAGTAATLVLAQLHYRREATIDEPFAVEGHGIAFRAHARVFHHALHAAVAGALVRPLDPRKHHRFVVLGLDGAAEVGDLAVGDIIAPALQDAGRAIFHEDRIAAIGVLDEFVLVGRGYGHHEAIDVGHGVLLWVGRCWVGRCARLSRAPLHHDEWAGRASTRDTTHVSGPDLQVLWIGGPAAHRLPAPGRLHKTK